FIDYLLHLLIFVINKTLLTETADRSMWCYQDNLGLCSVADLVIDASGTHALTDDGVCAICHMSDLAKSFLLYNDGFFIVLVIRFLLKFQFHSRLQEFIAVIILGSCQCEINLTHCPSS